MVLRKSFFLSAFFIVLSLFMIACSSTDEHYDIIIKGGKIVDGTGRAAFVGDIAIMNGKIVDVGNVSGDAASVIDANGLVVSPGFVDSHSHADFNILQLPLAENFIMQGVTMVLAGNCGMSAAPRKNLTFGEWVTKVEESGQSINLAPLVGHSTIRSLVMGQNFRNKATPEEIEKMKAYAEKAMRSGAFGFSTQLDPSGEHEALEDIIEVGKVAQKFGGLYSPHTYHHQNNWWTDNPEEYGYGILHTPPGEVIAGRYHGLLQAVEISKKANNIPLLIAHFTPAFKIPQPHPEWLQEAVAKATLEEIVDKARQRGQKVYFNAIACSYSVGNQQPVISLFLGQTGRTSRLAIPDWIKNIKKKEFVEKLKIKEFREKVKKVFYSGRFKVEMVHPLTDPYWIDCYRILTCKNKEYEGKTLGEIARKRSPDDIINAVYHESLEALFDILVEDPDTTWALILDKREYPGALREFFKHPAGMPCIDCGCMPAKLEGERKPGPSAYGMFPLYIDTFVKQNPTLTLEEAINHATYIPAQEVLGLKDRGIIASEAYADIVVFSLEEIKMAGDYINPNTPPDGIEYVLVNGKIVYKDKTHTGEKPGKILRHQH